jgi:hypothetical protein
VEKAKADALEMAAQENQEAEETAKEGFSIKRKLYK